MRNPVPCIIFYRLRGNQVKFLSDPVTVNREYASEMSLARQLRRQKDMLICKSGNLLDLPMKSFRGEYFILCQQRSEICSCICQGLLGHALRRKPLLT